MLSNAYFLAKFRFDTAENEPAKNLQNYKKKCKICQFCEPRRPEPAPAASPAAFPAAAAAGASADWLQAEPKSLNTTLPAKAAFFGLALKFFFPPPSPGEGPLTATSTPSRGRTIGRRRFGSGFGSGFCPQPVKFIEICKFNGFP